MSLANPQLVKSQMDQVPLFFESASANRKRGSFKAEETHLNLINSHQIINEMTLKSIFPDQKEENKLQQARRILGDTVANTPDEELEIYITEIHYLLDSWLDDYERQVFDNKTLKQILMEG